MIWLERRLLGLWQDRYGPNRVGPFGLGQVIADMVKIFFKEDWLPPFVDKFTFILAPALAMGLMLLMFALVPVTPTWGVADRSEEHTSELQSLMRISYAVFCLKKKKPTNPKTTITT